VVGGGDAAHFQLTVVARGLRPLTPVGYFDSFVWDVGTTPVVPWQETESGRTVFIDFRNSKTST
jgi:hypothetical protein